MPERVQRFLLTRAQSQGESLVALLQALGATVYWIPTIEIQPVPISDSMIDSLGRHHWIFFTSRNGVESFLGQLRERGKISILQNIDLAALGLASADALKNEGLSVRFQSPVATSRALAEHFVQEFPVRGQSILLVRPETGRPDLSQILTKHGANLEQCICYRNAIPWDSREKLKNCLDSGWVDAVIFSSGSTARHFAELLAPDMMARFLELRNRFKIISIGPSSSEAIRELGWTVDFEAPDHSVTGLFDLIKREFY